MAEPARNTTQVGDMTVDEQDYYNVLPVVQLYHDYLQKAHQDEDVREDEEYDDWEPPSFNDLFQAMVKTESNGSHRINSLNCDWVEFNAPTSVHDFMNYRLPFLPDSISLLDCLESLRFTYVERPTSLPRNISNLQNLRELEVFYLGGLRQLPEELANLVNLKKLTIRHNLNLRQLPGELPPNLEELNLKFAMIGTIPESVCALTHLKKLTIDFHRLSGIPQSFQNLSNLETIDTDAIYTCDYDIPAFVLELPRLKEIKVNAGSLVRFQSPEHYQGLLVVDCEVWSYDNSDVSDPPLSLHGWHKLTKLHVKNVGGSRSPDRRFLEGVFPSLAEIKAVRIDGRQLSRNSVLPGLEAEELLFPKGLEQVVLYQMVLVMSQEKVLSQSLRSLCLASCQLDYYALQLLDLPNLKKVVLLGGQINGAVLEHLCTEWFSVLKNLNELHCTIGTYPQGEGKGTPLSDVSIDALATLPNLRYMDFLTDDNTYEILEPQLLSLMMLNEARTKVLGGQTVPSGLWARIFAQGGLAFRNAGYDKCKVPASREMPQPDAIYALLQKRAAWDLFGES